MPQDLTTNISGFRKGNYVSYGGPLADRKDRIGRIESSQPITVEKIPTNHYDIVFDSEDDRTTAARDGQITGIGIGGVGVDVDNLSEFGFTCDPETGICMLGVLAVCKVGNIDEHGSFLGSQMYVYRTGEDPLKDKSNRVDFIHEVQNYSVDKYGQDYIADFGKTPIGKRWGPGTLFKILP